MPDIFISYRRDDTSGYAGRLYDQIRAHFGTGADLEKGLESRMPEAPDHRNSVRQQLTYVK